MAQHDYSISNAGFPATRADINNVLSAISTNNSGTSAPSSQFAGQFWIDTTSSTWTLYIHDGSDDIQFATIDTSANTVNFIDSELADGSVTNAKLGADAVDGDKIADDSIDSEHYVDGSIDTAHIANDAVDNTKLDLADDYTFTGKISGQNYPAFEAYLSANQSITNLTATKVQFDTEVFDTNSMYDNSTNYRFTPTVAGKYFVYSTVVGRDALTGTYNISQFNLDIRKNGSTLRLVSSYFNALAINFPLHASGSIDMNGTTDYLEIFATFRSSNSAASAAYADSQTTYFGAYRIGD